MSANIPLRLFTGKGEIDMIGKAIPIVVVLVISVFPLCQSEGKDRDYWPTQEWRYSLPEEQGLSASVFEKMEKYIGDTLWSTESMLIVRHGYVVFEKYYKSTSEELRSLKSVTKSFISALLGIAIEKGLVQSTDQKMIEFFPDYNERNDINSTVREVSLHHLLTMSAPLSFFPSPKSLELLFKSHLDGRLKVNFNYNNSCAEMISIILTSVSKLTAANFADKYLFKPIGIETYSWLESNGISSGGIGLSLRTIDMARFGYLYLNKGSWDGKQLIPETWIDLSTKNQISGLIAGEYADSYGYYWWLDEANGYKFYFALGLPGAKIIAVIPELDIVIVTTSSSNVYPGFYSLVKDYLIPAVKK